jgi:hypothetical protein
MTRHLNRSAAVALAVVLIALTLTASSLTLAASGRGLGKPRVSPPLINPRVSPSPDTLRMTPFVRCASSRAPTAARCAIQGASVPLSRYNY